MFVQETFHYPWGGWLIPGICPESTKRDKCGRIAAHNLMLMFYKVLYSQSMRLSQHCYKFSQNMSHLQHVGPYTVIDSSIQVWATYVGVPLASIPPVCDLFKIICPDLSEMKKHWENRCSKNHLQQSRRLWVVFASLKTSVRDCV